ncbi:O-antigen ligase family protein [Ideonella sp.]|uniref:O-antigen ligase family protein n=1 Tax=Ideonella sp. TaxID=1929293 RepID=UPI003BB4C116
MDALYLLSIPFVSAFNVSQIFIIPLMLALLGLVWYGGTGRLDRLHLIQADFLMLFFLACVLISTAVNLPHLSAKNLNHVLAVCAGYLIFYLGAERLTQHLSIERVLHLLFIGYLISTIFGLLEFVLVNFTSINLNDFVFRPAVEDYTPGFLDIVLIRARSLFEESGYFAAYMAMMAPLMAFYLWKIRTERWLRVLFVVLTLASYFAAFSVSLFIFLPFAVAVTVVLRTLQEGRITRGALISFAILTLIAIVVLSSPVLMELLFLRKFEGGSFQDRNEKFAATLDLVMDADWWRVVFGHGPGSYFNLGIKPAISVYLNYLRDLGVVGLSAYLLLMGFVLVDLLRDRSPFGVALFVSALVIQLFYISTPIYFLPYYFIPMLLYRMRIVRGRNPERTPAAPLSAAGSAG